MAVADDAGVVVSILYSPCYSFLPLTNLKDRSDDVSVTTSQCKQGVDGTFTSSLL